MKKLVLLFCAFLFLHSCSPFDIVDEKRVLVKGKFEDTSGEPIAGIPIQLITNTGLYYLWYGNISEDVIYEHSSSNSGEFSFTSFDVEDDIFVIAINHPGWDDYRSGDYEFLRFVDERNERGENLIDFQTLTLRKRIDFNLVFVNTSGTGENLSYIISYSDIATTVEVQNWNHLPSVEEIHNTTEIISHTNDLVNGQNFSHIYPTLDGTQAVLTYRVGGNPPIEVIVPILSEDFTYEISY